MLVSTSFSSSSPQNRHAEIDPTDIVTAESVISLFFNSPASFFAAVLDTVVWRFASNNLGEAMIFAEISKHSMDAVEGDKRRHNAGTD